MLAYLAPSDGVLNVWSRTIGHDDDRVVTRDRKRTVREFHWQEDSKHILYLQDQEGDENFHVFQADLETTVTRDLTPFLGAKAAILAADPRFPDTILVQLNFRDPRLFDVYRLNPKGGRWTSTRRTLETRSGLSPTTICKYARGRFRFRTAERRYASETTRNRPGARS